MTAHAHATFCLTCFAKEAVADMRAMADPQQASSVGPIHAIEITGSMTHSTMDDRLAAVFGRVRTEAGAWRPFTAFVPNGMPVTRAIIAAAVLTIAIIAISDEDDDEDYEQPEDDDEETRLDALDADAALKRFLN
ncbi:hypothetical protein [Maritimibacter sp. DP1N21-5]|uniref:hypothetical protein n=1 Tax=Maritimibacter sp. DP1N21-5 TaxID=2836867 RepID=UPI001C48E55C|nr:hypothetical protein [Maritimibacter sp. DP1N21-5]MBV7408756.1 hypothetical protein [Maritimibacter sp. DP1N21-5]